MPQQLVGLSVEFAQTLRQRLRQEVLKWKDFCISTVLSINFIPHFSLYYSIKISFRSSNVQRTGRNVHFESISGSGACIDDEDVERPSICVIGNYVLRKNVQFSVKFVKIMRQNPQQLNVLSKWRSGGTRSLEKR